MASRVSGRGRIGVARSGMSSMDRIQTVIERHADGCVAYPVGVKGVVVGEGETYEEARRDVQSALRFHLETFGPDALEGEDGPVLEAFVAEATI